MLQILSSPHLMKKTLKDIIIAVSVHGDVTLISGPNVWELDNFVGDMSVNEYFPSCWHSGEEEEEDRNGFPSKRGVYCCTIITVFHQGYFEGYACDSESDWDIICDHAEKIEL